MAAEGSTEPTTDNYSQNNDDQDVTRRQRMRQSLSSSELHRLSIAVPPDSAGSMSRDELEHYLFEKMGLKDDAGRKRALETLICKLDPKSTGRIFLPDFVVATMAPKQQDAPFKQQAQHLVDLLTSRAVQTKDPTAVADEVFTLLDTDKNDLLLEDEIARLFTFSGAYDPSEVTRAAHDVLIALDRQADEDDEGLFTSQGLSRREFILGLVSGKLSEILKEAFEGLRTHRPARIIHDLRLDAILDLFDDADRDNTGQIDRDEFKTTLQQFTGGEGLSRIGRIDLDEISRRLFASLDDDGDGMLTFAQFKAALIDLFDTEGNYTGVTGLAKLEIEALEYTVNSLEDQLKESQQQVDFTVSQMRKHELEHDTTLRQYEKEMDEREEELESEAESVRLQCDELREKLKNANEELLVLHQELNELRLQNHEEVILTKRTDELKTELLDMQRELIEERMAHASLRDGIDELEAAHAEEAKKLAEEAQTLRDRMAQIEVERSERAALIKLRASGSVQSVAGSVKDEDKNESMADIVDAEQNRLTAEYKSLMQRHESITSLCAEEIARVPSRKSILEAESREHMFVKGSCQCRICDVERVTDIPKSPTAKPKAYIVYTMEVQASLGKEGKVWLLERRYSEFDALHRALKRQNITYSSVIKLPPKRYINIPGHHSMDSAFVARRRERLQAYIDVVLALPEMKNLPAIGQFFATNADAVEELNRVMKTRSREHPFSAQIIDEDVQDENGEEE